MSHRHRVANRRAHETIAIEHDGQRYKIGLGREVACIARGMLGPIVEVFVNAQQVNSSADLLASDGAILMSMLLQYGCPPAAIHHALKRNSDGTPASPLGRAAAFLVEERNNV
jgi:hemin uptake protein HemP